MNIEQLKYPIGKYIANKQPDQLLLTEWIHAIASFPRKVAALVEQASSEQFAWKYRPEGWTVKQVIDHCCDSHINSFIRFKFALTENNPTVFGYNQTAWIEQADAKYDEVNNSIQFLVSLHKKWVLLLQNLTDNQFQRELIHSETGKTTIAEMIGMYAWHSNHHLAHIKQGLQSEGKYN